MSTILKLRSLRAPVRLEAEWVAAKSLLGVSFLVSSLNLPAFVAAREKLALDFAMKYRDGKVPAAERHSATGRLLAEHILHDWRGFDEPYSRDVALELLTDPEFRVLAGEIEDAAAGLALPAIAFVEDAGKNSGPPSAGI